MKTALRAGCLAAAATLGTALLAAPASAAPAAANGAARATARSTTSVSASTQHAVFVQTDETTGNHVAAYRQAVDGSLSLAGTYATGGLGGVLDNSVIDHLASQGALTYDARRHLLYAVNAGSNTLSVFAVHGAQLRLRQTITTAGSFPVSVATHGDAVYVLNGHDGGSIQGYVVALDHLYRIPSWHRALGLDPTQLNFTESPGQIGFSPDGSKLIVTTKANGNDIEVFSVRRFGGVVGQAVVTVDANGVPFAFTWDPAGDFVLTSAGSASVDSYRLNQDGSLTLLGSAPITQKGTCWVVSDGALLFATNPGSSSVTGLTASATGPATVASQTPTDAGTVDPAVSADGQYLYVETGAAGIVDEYAVHSDATLTAIGSVTVANAAGAEGIATS